MIFFPEKCQIDHVKNIIRLLNIPDNKERENLMTLHQDYVSACKNQKEGIYRLLETALANVLCGVCAPYCVEPVLSFLKMIVRKEHLASILYTHLLPLYCHEKLYLYSNKLTNLVVKIIENRQTDHLKCVEYFVNHFPLQCGSKQCLFVYALNSIFNTMIRHELDKLATKLIPFFAYAVSSPNSKLAEPSLKLLLKPVMTSVLFSNLSWLSITFNHL